MLVERAESWECPETDPSKQGFVDVEFDCPSCDISQGMLVFIPSDDMQSVIDGDFELEVTCPDCGTDITLYCDSRNRV